PSGWPLVRAWISRSFKAAMMSRIVESACWSFALIASLRLALNLLRSIHALSFYKAPGTDRAQHPHGAGPRSAKSGSSLHALSPLPHHDRLAATLSNPSSIQIKVRSDHLPGALGHPLDRDGSIP